MTMTERIDSSAPHSSRQHALADLIDRHCPNEGSTTTRVPGLLLFRGSYVSSPTCTIALSAFGMMAQGAKRLTLGEEVFEYDAGHYIVSSVELPMAAQITRASASEPYLGLALVLEPLKIAEICSQLPPQTRLENGIARALAVSPLSPQIQDAAFRLASLLDTPDDIPMLAPLFERELLYRLLVGPLGPRLREATISGSHSNQVARTIGWLKQNLAQAIRIDDLAGIANMSKSSLHHHFKALTAMTPLQYQKQLRLQEARRLMLTERHDAASAAHRVGYESPSQFSREYRRMFGTPPAREVMLARQQEQAAGSP
jgi:AraC-like DNA-binding protein